jgi:hypothetical protein
MKIGNGTKIQLFKKVRRWDPLKTTQGEVLKKNEKSIGKSMLFDGLGQPKINEHMEKYKKRKRKETK